jgi:GGDEF domain-containing protein
MLCHGVAEADAEALGQRIAEAVSRPVELAGVEVVVGASVGVLGVDAFLNWGSADSGGATVPSADDLLRTVDAAMYEAKRGGGGVRKALARS